MPDCQAVTVTLFLLQYPTASAILPLFKRVAVRLGMLRWWRTTALPLLRSATTRSLGTLNPLIPSVLKIRALKRIIRTHHVQHLVCTHEGAIKSEEKRKCHFGFSANIRNSTSGFNTLSEYLTTPKHPQEVDLRVMGSSDTRSNRHSGYSSRKAFRPFLCLVSTCSVDLISIATLASPITMSTSFLS